MRIQSRTRQTGRLAALIMIGLCASLGVVSGGAARAATNVEITRQLLGVNAGCTSPQYNFFVTGTSTANDDGSGNDIVSVVMYDAAYRFLDLDTVYLPAGGVATLSYSVADRIAARPLRVRVFDTVVAVSESPTGLGIATGSPLVGELAFDPALDHAECALVGQGPEIRFESSSTSVPLYKYDPAPIVADSMTVITPESARLVVSYSAECTVAGPSSAWVGIQIDVDGQTISPTGPSYALCSGSGTGELDEWVAARAIGVVEVGAGAHLIEVIGDGSSAADRWRWDDRSLVVTVPEPGSTGLLLAGSTLLAGLGRVRRRPRGVFGFALAMVAALVLAPADGEAQTRMHFGNDRDPKTILPSVPVYLGLNHHADELFRISPDQDERQQITVSAECSVSSSTDHTTFVAIEILINGVVIAPTAPDFAFCTSDGGGGASWVSATMTVIHDFVYFGGVEDFEVRATLQGADPGEYATIDDLAFVVIRTLQP